MELATYLGLDCCTCAVGLLTLVLVAAMKPDPETHALKLREQQLNASRGPHMTFLCKQCMQARGIIGRKLVNKQWVCKGCSNELA